MASGHDGILALDGASDRLSGCWIRDCYSLGLFADPASGKLYWVSESPGLVSVIDPATNSLLTTVPFSSCPEAIAFNSVDHKVYVAGGTYGVDGGTIAVLDAVGDTVLTEITLGDPHCFLAYDADDDLLYAADYYSHRLLAIDGKTDCVVDSCWVDELPVGLLYNHARQRLYCFGNEGGVTAITPRMHGQDNRITVGAGLRRFTLNSSGTMLYGGNWGRDSVYAIDCVGETLACVIPVASAPVAFCYDSRRDRIYCASAGDSTALVVVDCTLDRVVDVIPVSGQFLFYDSTSDAVYCLGRAGLAVIDAQTHAVVRTFGTGSSPVGLASAPLWPCVYAADDRELCLWSILKASGPAEMGVEAVPAAQATVARGNLRWVGEAQAAVFDRSGRRVADLHKGDNDVGRLAPGVYFVREAQAQAQTVRKVVITR